MIFINDIILETYLLPDLSSEITIIVRIIYALACFNVKMSSTEIHCNIRKCYMLCFFQRSKIILLLMLATQTGVHDNYDYTQNGGISCAFYICVFNISLINFCGLPVWMIEIIILICE